MFRVLTIMTVMLLACAAYAQTANQTPQQAPPQLPPGGITQAPAQLPAGDMTQAPAQLPAGDTTSSAPPVDAARRMELDLNQMESLLNNMAAQVSFIRDTNMSILLNTNVQLWSVLIRDLRLQLQEQQRGGTKSPGSPQRHGDTER